MSDERKGVGILLSEYLETQDAEWVHRETEGKPDSYEVDVELTSPEGDTIVIRTNAGAICFLINATAQTIEAESEDQEMGCVVRGSRVLAQPHPRRRRAGRSGAQRCLMLVLFMVVMQKLLVVLDERKP